MASSQTRVEEDAARNSSDARSDAPPVRKRRRVIIRILLLIIAVLLAYTALDLFGPRSSRMRGFDPNEVARLETAMWRSYYDKQHLPLAAIRFSLKLAGGMPALPGPMLRCGSPRSPRRRRGGR